MSFPEPYFDNGMQTIYLGDFKDVLSAPSDGQWQFEAVITDPPYAKKYSRLWLDLAKSSFAVLREGGSLLSIVPHYLLVDVTAIIGQYLKYRWIIAMDQHDGPHPRMAMGIEVAWKPIVWWVKGSWPAGRGFRIDRFRNIAPKNKRHKWEQGMTWANAMLKFVPEKQPILDPMMGTGTLLVAAAYQGYPAVGIDSDERCCEIAANRLRQIERGIEDVA